MSGPSTTKEKPDKPNGGDSDSGDDGKEPYSLTSAADKMDWEESVTGIKNFFEPPSHSQSDRGGAGH
jgi:hypothetical protein